MKLTDYVFTEDMSYPDFIKANPDADEHMEEDEDLCDAIQDYYALKAMAEHDRRIEQADHPLASDHWDGDESQQD